jgi:hypothetical protein
LTCDVDDAPRAGPFETVNFNPNMSFRGSNPDTMRLAERFTSAHRYSRPLP